jgi:uncharacterized protein YbjT (DUF2867 family)
MYAITGATGHTGRRIAEALLAEGKQVRCIGRSAERLGPLEKAGAEIAVGSVDDAAFLSKAFNGAEAVYAMIPPDPRAENFRGYQNRIGEAIAKAVSAAGVKYVVNLSSLGADLPDKTGPVVGLHDQEERLNKLDGVNVLHLRPTFFFENLMALIPMVKNMGVAGSSVKADLPVPMIATRDVAKEAAQRLLKLDFKGHTAKEMLGQRHVSFKEVAEILGKAAGIDHLKYVVVPYEDTVKAMVQIGISQDVARASVELQRSVNDRTAMTNVVRTIENTTETPIEEFAGIWAAALKSS